MQKRLPLNLQRQNSQIQNYQHQVASHNEEIKKIKFNIREKENQLKTHQNTIEKRKENLNQAKSNKEYSALGEEIQKLTIEKDDLEISILELMEHLEQENEKNNQHKKYLQNLEKEGLQYEKEMNIELQKIEQELETLQKERNKQREVVHTQDKELCATYEHLIKADPRSAIVKTEDNACGFCRVELHMTELATVRSGNVATCKNCFRLMYG